jgi:hypothetical protein
MAGRNVIAGIALAKYQADSVAGLTRPKALPILIIPHPRGDGINLENEDD